VEDEGDDEDGGDESGDDVEEDERASSSSAELPALEELGDSSAEEDVALGRLEANRAEYVRLDGGVDAGEIGRQLLLCIFVGVGDGVRMNRQQGNPA
jgi:hypothetical protein